MPNGEIPLDEKTIKAMGIKPEKMESKIEGEKPLEKQPEVTEELRKTVVEEIIDGKMKTINEVLRRIKEIDEELYEELKKQKEIPWHGPFTRLEHLLRTARWTAWLSGLFGFGKDKTIPIIAALFHDVGAPSVKEVGILSYIPGASVGEAPKITHEVLEKLGYEEGVAKGGEEGVDEHMKKLRPWAWGKQDFNNLLMTSDIMATIEENMLAVPRLFGKIFKRLKRKSSSSENG